MIKLTLEQIKELTPQEERELSSKGTIKQWLDLYNIKWEQDEYSSRQVWVVIGERENSFYKNGIEQIKLPVWSGGGEWYVGGDDCHTKLGVIERLLEEIK